MPLESSEPSVSHQISGSDQSKTAQAQSTENLQSYTSYLRGCPEQKVGNPHEALGLYVSVPKDGLFTEHLESQSQRLANLLQPACTDRKPFAGVELDRVHEWAAQFGPHALQRLSEATNDKLKSMHSAVRMNISSRYEMVDMVKTAPGDISKKLDQVRLSVHDSTMTLSRGGSPEFKATVRTLPREYRSQDWMTREVYDILKTVQAR